MDLDGAFDGAPARRPHPAWWRRCCSGRGGGLRDLPPSRRRSHGGRWAVLGTAAALSRATLDAACRKWPGRSVGVDAVDGRVAVRGWTHVLPSRPSSRRAAASRRGGVSTPISTGTEVAAERRATARWRRGVGAHRSSGGSGRRRPRPLAAIPNVAGPSSVELYTGAIDLGAAIAAVAADGHAGPARDPVSRRQGWPRRQGRAVLDLADAGDPVEAAIAYDGKGRTTRVPGHHRHPEGRVTMLDVVRRTAGGVPAADRRRRPRQPGGRADLLRPAPTRCPSTRRRWRPR